MISARVATEIGASDPDSSAYERALSFYRQVEEEVHSACALYPVRKAARIHTYYQNLIRHPTWAAYYRHNWARRVSIMAREILAMRHPVQILDAGCGTGTEALYFASLGQGVQVLAIDCDTSAVEVGPLRKRVYEQLIGRELIVDFQNGTLLNYPYESQFDGIWLMESVSHIHPLPSWFMSLPGLLKADGIVTVSDSSIRNPVMLARVFRLRWRGSSISRLTLKTGQTVEIADEHLLTPEAVEQELLGLGFRLAGRNLGGYFPPLAGRWSGVATHLQSLENVCARVPGLSAIAGIYTITARKPKEHLPGVRH